MKLYELTKDFAELFDQFDAICNYEPATNELGEYINDDGELIEDIEVIRHELLEAWFDTLTGIEDGFDIKAENIAAYIKNELAEVDAMKKEEAALAKRRRTKENQVERMKKYLLDSMNKIGRTKIDTPKAKISVKNNAESVKIDDEKGFITMCINNGRGDILRYKDPEINKTAVKKLLQSGEIIAGAELKRTQSLIIK